MPVRFKQDSNYVPGVNRARFPITGTGAIRNVGSSLPGSRMPILADNYLVYYFDELSGTTVTNYGAATGNNLTLTGAGVTRGDSTIYPKGTLGTAIARTSPITYASKTSLAGMPYAGGGGTGWTAEITCGWSETWSGSEDGIFEMSLGTTWPNIFVMKIYRSSLTQISYNCFGTWGGQTINATVPSSTNLCHAVAIVRNQPGNNDTRMDFYVNGQKANNTDIVLPFGSNASTFDKIYVGTTGNWASGSTWGSAVNACPYGFKVGEVRVSAGTVRNATYIQQAYQNALNIL